MLIAYSTDVLTHKYRPITVSCTTLHTEHWLRLQLRMISVLDTTTTNFQLATGNQAFINLQFLIVDIIRHFIYILMVEDRFQIVVESVNIRSSSSGATKRWLSEQWRIFECASSLFRFIVDVWIILYFLNCLKWWWMCCDVRLYFCMSECCVKMKFWLPSSITV